jgi:hypothetical protein
MPKSDVPDLRKAFRKFAGEARFSKFVRAISQTCPRKERLLFWQEQLWREFVETTQDVPTGQDQILRAFRICDIHDCELGRAPGNDPLPEIRQTQEYAQASETLFPLATSRYWVCATCRAQRQRWISDHAELCRILRRKTTYEAYCDRLLDGITGPKEREAAKRAAKPRIQERAAEIAAQMRPGDELWEWDGGGWHCFTGRGGVAIVRAGEVVKKWCEAKS